MKVGVVAEIKNNEFRVGLTPNCVAMYVENGHSVLVEKDAGLGSGFEDEEYVEAGGKIVATAKEVWDDSEMVVKVKEPIEPEYQFLRKDLILYTYLHLAADRPLTEALLKAGTKSIAYETITEDGINTPCLRPMSIIAGRMSTFEGAKYLEKTYGGRGVLLAGVPGVEKGKVTIIGGGTVGTEACKIAIGLGAEVTILELSQKRLEYLDDIFGSRVQTLKSTRANILDSIKEADIVVGAVLLPGKKAPTLLKREDLPLMKTGAVIVDVAVDQGGCFETTKATTHESPIFNIDDVVHYCVANMPGAVARSATLALTNTTLNFGIMIANKGLDKSIQDSTFVMNGVNTYSGKCTCQGVADAFEMEFVEARSLL